MTIGGEGEERDLYDEALRKKTRASVLWTLVRTASDRVFSFFVFVTLARLLFQHEIGTFAIAYAFAEVGRVMAAGGMTQSVARAKTVSPALSDTPSVTF